MKRIIDIIKNIINRKDTKKVLGRWELDSCNIRVNKKIDYSNEDHCGPCGSESLKTALQNTYVQAPPKLDINKKK
jgi:hypothetical protein